MRISIKEAAQMMQTSEQFVRVSIFAGRIPGAYKVGRTYFVTEEQIKNMMEGRVNNENNDKNIQLY